jgi:SAM-dependent methyltransferase
MPEELYPDKMTQVYDLIYDQKYGGMKNYESEAKRVKELFWAHFAIRPLPLGYDTGYRHLEVACGTGLHLQHLAWTFRSDGLDLSESMLAIARERVPAVSLYQGDMRDFDLGMHYSLITCLFSAIAHLETLAELRAAIGCMAAHLCLGGVLLVEPYIDPADFRPGRISVERGKSTDLEVVRVTRSARDGHINRCEMHHFVTRNDIHEEPFTVTLPLAMYTRPEVTAAFEAAGLEVHYDEHGLMGRGLFIGIKPL